MAAALISKVFLALLFLLSGTLAADRLSKRNTIMYNYKLSLQGVIMWTRQRSLSLGSHPAVTWRYSFTLLTPRPSWERVLLQEVTKLMFNVITVYSCVL